MKDSQVELQSELRSGIDRVLNFFKRDNPKVELECDKRTMGIWYNFIAWCYSYQGEVHLPDLLDKGIKISSLMQLAINECESCWEHYNTDHQLFAQSLFKCDECEEDENGWSDSDCWNCEGEGYDADKLWNEIDDAMNNIISKIDINSFKILSVQKKDDKSKLRVNWDETDDEIDPKDEEKMKEYRRKRLEGFMDKQFKDNPDFFKE